MIVNDLPPEILGAIFEAAIDSIPIGRGIHKCYIIRRSHRWEPLNFVHVCRYWRAVALSMQILWSSIDANEFKPEAFTHWLNFARSSPLNLSYWPREGFEWGQPVEDGILRKSAEMLHQFSLCADRWGSLYFRVQNVELTGLLASMLSTSASGSPLERLDIAMNHDNTPPKVIEILASAIASFPSLHSLSWTFNSIQATLPRMLPWHALEDVYVSTCVEGEDFLWCLTQCTSARRVTLLGIDREPKRRHTNAFINVRCTLPRLKSLTINECCDPYRLLQHFTLPSLVYLEIQTVYGPSNALQDFLDRSQSALQTFKLDVDDMKPEDVIGCLSTPYLRRVPEVILFLCLKNLDNYLQDLLLISPDLLRNFPKLRAWEDRFGHNIGWKKVTC